MQLLQDIRLGKINCVIVKDLSRFGRNYLEAGDYIEKIFPFLGVRFIAVADGFDTGKEGNENNQMASEIKNLINDMYAKDFSKKAKLHLEQMRTEGSYAGGPPPYGYLVGWCKKQRFLIPDENTKAVVQFIYEKFVELESYTAVADELNRRRINPPLVYQKTKEVYHLSDEINYKGWDKGAVARIIKSETYAGNLVQGKTSITARNEKNRIRKSEDDWVVTEGAHEPLIGKELYRSATQVNQKIKARTAVRKHPSKGLPIGENIFDNVLFCGVCGRKMTRNSYVKQYADGKQARLDGYFCQNGGQTKVTVCPKSNRISKNELFHMLLPVVRIQFEVFLHGSIQYMEYGKERIEKIVKKTERGLSETEGKIRRFREEEGSIYMDYHAGKMLQKDYLSYKMKRKDRLEELNKQMQERKKETEALEKLETKYLAAIKALLKFISEKDLTKDVVEALISKISVYPGKRIEVIFAFKVDCIKG